VGSGPVPDPDPGPTPGAPTTALFHHVRGAIQAGQPAQVRFEVHEADDVQIPAADLRVMLRSPDGSAEDQPCAANPSGRYRSLVRTEAVGTYRLEVQTACGRDLGHLDLTVEQPRGIGRG
jgi:hypothetical protein